jgi:hypothetical protein
LINTKVISPIIYLASSHSISKKSLVEIDKLIFNFLWDGKPPKIKRNVIISSLENGGIKIPLFSEKYKSLRIFWLKSCLNNSNQLWKAYLSEICGIDTHKIVSAGTSSKSLPNLPPFYSEIFDLATKYLHDASSNKINLENEHITYNENLCLEGTTLKDSNLYNAKIRNLYNADRSLKSARILSNEFNIPLMRANSILSLVPRSWKERLKHKNTLDTDENLYIDCGAYRKNLLQTTSRIFYKLLIDKISETPTSIATWCSKANIEIDLENWRFYFRNIYNMSFKQEHQAFQFKLLHPSS